MRAGLAAVAPAAPPPSPPPPPDPLGWFGGKRTFIALAVDRFNRFGIVEFVFLFERDRLAFRPIGQRLCRLKGVHLLAAVDDKGLRRDERIVGVDGDDNSKTLFQRPQMRALVIENVERDVATGARDEIMRGALDQLLLQRAEHLQRQRGHRTDMAAAAARRTFLRRALEHAGANALARHFQQAEMRPTWIRPRSCLRQSLSRRSTLRLLRFSSISMKSMTIRPARSRKRNWRAISSAASKLVLSAVSSM